MNNDNNLHEHSRGIKDKMIDIENKLNKHIQEHCRQQRIRTKQKIQIQNELYQLRTSIDNLPLALKQLFVTKEQLSKQFCQNNFNRMMTTHNQKKLDRNSKLIENLKGLLIIGSSVGIATILNNLPSISQLFGG